MSDTTHFPVTRVTGLHRLTCALRNSFRRIAHEHRARMTIDTLERLGDHTLRDIGLARDEIRSKIRSGAFRK